MPRVPRKVASRITSGVRKFQKILARAKDRDVNESDTVVIIADFVSEVLGFEKYREITTEFAIRGTYCDLAVKVGGIVQYLIEAKAVGITLKGTHLRQAVTYAAQHGVEWVVLTSGAMWHVYRMRFEQPVRHDLVFSLDLLNADPKSEELIEHLFLLSREGMAKSAIEEFQIQKDACSPFLIAQVLLRRPLLSTVRRELRRISPKAKFSEQDVEAALKEEVFKRDVLEGAESQAAITRVKRASNRALRKARRKRSPHAEASAAPSVQPNEEPLSESST